MFGNNQDTDTNVPADASKQVYNIRDLSTKSVVLYPTRAHVTREISNVQLRTGANEVEIYGLSPTVDEHSIQVEGQSTVNVVDMSVQLVPNRDIYDEIYPEDDESSDDESDLEYEDSDDEDGTVKSISKELKDLRLEVTKQNEIQTSANERLVTLDRYAKSAEAEHLSPDDVSKLLNRYHEDRSKIFEVHTTATQKLVDLEKQIRRKEVERANAGKESRKQKEASEKQKFKERRRKDLQRAEQKKQAKYVKQERMRCWAKKVFKITLLLETSSLDTPGSSRRNSLDTVTLASQTPLDPNTGKPTPGPAATSPVTIPLLLSYVTKEAGWSPRYDLQISSVQKSAKITYRTEFLNRTSETWKDAKLSFSTSQTSYQGLDDVVPFMHAWHVRLVRYTNGDGGLLSAEEANKPRGGRPDAENFNRAEVFGLDDNFIPVYQSKRLLEVQKSNNVTGLFGPSSRNARPGGLFGSSTKAASGGFGGGYGSGNPYSSVQNTSLFGSSRGAAAPMIQRIEGKEEEAREDVVQANVQLDQSIQSARSGSRSVASSVGGLFGARRKSQARHVNMKEKDETLAYGYDPTIEDSEREPPPPSFNGDDDDEEASWEGKQFTSIDIWRRRLLTVYDQDNGLTATFEVPGTRTLEPSSLTRRHKIASLHASNIHLSHICVPKLRSAAFLRTKIRNPSSSVTLLKGSAGVTLDGSFLGNMTLPRVSPNQIFDLPLGVDPAIHVNYPKPSVHRSTQGIIFNKESAQVFTRSIWLNNTKPTPVDMLVLDQIPVSEDERLRIVVVSPRGLNKEGDSAKAGVSAKEGSSGGLAVAEGGKDGKKEVWGSAVAKLKKGGEVGWTVKLEGGKGCLLKLDYEARLPSAEKIVAA